MKILFTGGSSFTGFWFIRELARTGHDVVATFRKRPEEYADEPRRTRVGLLLKSCRGVFNCSFGDSQFVELIASQPWDLLCHHAAEVTDYKSKEFDAVAALEKNTLNVAMLLRTLRSGGRETTKVLLTGSVFENDEGAGSQGLPAFSPYGLSKSFTYQVFRYHAARVGLALGKFVIPNPFGAYEDVSARFTAYLMRTWFNGGKAVVNTPAYVRDNIHVSLLARCYARFAEGIPETPGVYRLNPSGYAESQGAFAVRFATEIRRRLPISCELELKRQVAFPEPRVRINTDLIEGEKLGWDEGAAWDEIADYYNGLLGSRTQRMDQLHDGIHSPTR